MTDSSQINHPKVRDEIIRQTIAIYRWAVFISFGFLAIGFVLDAFTDQMIATRLAMPADIVQQLMAMEASGFLGLGILAMIVTPIIMITAGAVAFFRANDRRFGMITLAVALVLTLSIVISFVVGK